MEFEHAAGFFSQATCHHHGCVGWFQRKRGRRAGAWVFQGEARLPLIKREKACPQLLFSSPLRLRGLENASDLKNSSPPRPEQRPDENVGGFVFAWPRRSLPARSALPRKAPRVPGLPNFPGGGPPVTSTAAMTSASPRGRRKAADLHAIVDEQPTPIMTVTRPGSAIEVATALTSEPRTARRRSAHSSQWGRDGRIGRSSSSSAHPAAKTGPACARHRRAWDCRARTCRRRRLIRDSKS